MARVRLLLAVLAIFVVMLASTPSNAGGLCYNIKVTSKGRVLINQWVGLCTSSAEAVSTTVQQLGATTLETTRYAG